MKHLIAGSLYNIYSDLPIRRSVAAMGGSPPPVCKTCGLSACPNLRRTAPTVDEYKPRTDDGVTVWGPPS
jgi:hypothetical protein